MIIITHSRKELVKRQKACIDYVSKGISNGIDPNDKRLQEAVQDCQRWSKESGIYKNRDEKGMKWITTFERKVKEKQNNVESQ